YINYSANLSDYLFTSQIKSFVHQSSVMDIWNKSDKNIGTHASFPGFLIFTLALFALFKIVKTKNVTSISIELNTEKTFFLILIIAGLIFSLGPRLKFNGNYAHIPLPYMAIIEYLPGADSTRVPARWSFLFFLGFAYFSLITLNKLEEKPYKRLILPFIFIIFLLEYIPTNIQGVKDSYINNDYQILKNSCLNEKKVLLELPITHLNAYPNIVEGLRYVTILQLASTYHGCFLVNGYSGYDLPENFILSNTIDRYIENQQTTAFLEELKARNIDYVKFNQSYFIKELKEPAYKFIQAIATESGVEKIDVDMFYINRKNN
ncbi:MAG: hypothetical protein Q7R95_07435, partial [bacterium]|nr:hypothetical protein [bacterium]